MKKIVQFVSVLLTLTIIAGGLFGGIPSLASESKTFKKARPSVNGKLSVSGTNLVDKDGVPVVLKGLSTHGLTWFPDFIDDSFFKQLSADWDCDLIRLAMYSEIYVQNPADSLSLMKKGIEYAINNDMYVIVDWHILNDSNPKIYEKESNEFFRYISSLYSDCPNIIYEICNEPNGATTWNDIYEYSENIIPAIRNNSPESIIIVGTPFWSQRLSEAADRPLGYDNIMYALHFYVSTHRKDLQDVLIEANRRGLPVFVSECGISEASGSGYADFDSASVWFRLLEERGISFTVWNISNKAETSALFSPSYVPPHPFTDADLTSGGLWVKEMLKNGIG